MLIMLVMPIILIVRSIAHHAHHTHRNHRTNAAFAVLTLFPADVVNCALKYNSMPPPFEALDLCLSCKLLELLAVEGVLAGSRRAPHVIASSLARTISTLRLATIGYSVLASY